MADPTSPPLVSGDPDDAGAPGKGDVEPESIEPDGVDSEEADATDAAGASRTRNLVEWVVVIVGALVVALLIKTFLFQAFYIPSESMVPTLGVGDRVIVNKLSEGTGRGDLIVFAKPEGEGGSVQDLIKRVIGLPGETVSARDNQLFIDRNDGEGPVALDEPYLPEGTVTNDFQGTAIPDGQLFVMGDNRDDSRDSRFFGPIPEDEVVGRAFVRVWPPSEIGFL
jgi:signal peptidase I